MTFEKADHGAVLVKRIESRLYRDRRELSELLRQVEEQRVPAPHLVALLGHAEEEVRVFAVRRIAESGDTSVVDMLLRGMVGQPETVRRDLAGLALQVNARYADSRVGPLAAAKRTEHREVALALLAVHPAWQSHMGVLKATLGDPVPEMRRRAAQIMAKDPRHPAVFLLLKELLHDDDQGLRREALHALATTQHPDIVEPFLERLPLEGEVERAVIVRALCALASDPRVKLDEKILPALADDRETVRAAAVQLLGHLPDRTRFLRTFLHDGSSMVYWLRERCEKALLGAGEALVEPLLALLRDQDENVRVGALMLAANVRDPRFLGPMRDLFLSQADWWVRVLAADVLGSFAHPDVIALLASRLGDPELRHGVIAALGKTKSPHAAPWLLRALQDPAPGIRSCALDALRGFAEPAVVATVAQLAVSDPVDALRDKAMSVLGTMGPAGAQALADLQAQAAAGAAVDSVAADGLAAAGAALPGAGACVAGAAGGAPAPLGELEMLNPALNQRA